MLDEEECKLLKLKAPSAGMLLEHIFYDFDNKPVSWGWFVCDNTRLRLHTRIGIEQVNGTRDERTR
jgi:GntR family transcriptional regulator